MHLKSFCLDVGNREDGNACHCFESVTEKLALLSILTTVSELIKYSIKEGRRRRSRRNVYLLKIEAKSFRDTRQNIGKDTESNLGSFASFQG